MRRRRRKFGFKRKERREKDPEGETPDEEIAKKLNNESADAGVAEMGGAGIKKADMNVSGTHEKKELMGDGVVSELPLGNETEVQELPGQEQAHEVGGGGFFVAELDSKEIERRKSLRATGQPVHDDHAAPPVPQNNAMVSSDLAMKDTTVPKIVVDEAEGNKT